MPDQAAGLRSLFARRRPSLLIVAGCDANKAAVAVHFAREAAASRRATVLVDGTPGQVASACDLACRYELAHVVAGDKTLADVLRPLTPHLLMLPAARALTRFSSFSPDEEARLTDAFAGGIAQALAQLAPDGDPQDAQVDLIVVNAGADGAGRAVDAFGRDARVVVVAVDRPASLRGAYAEMKALSQHRNLEHFEIVVPRFDEDEPPSLAFANLAATARRFLDIELKDGGSVLLPRPRALPASSAASTILPLPAAVPAAPIHSYEEVPHAAAIG